MSPQELRAFLAQERWCVLGTLDPDGHPFAEPAACRFYAGGFYAGGLDEDGPDGDALLFEVAAGSRSLAHIRRDPRVCCATDRYPSYYEIRGATVHGRAQPAGAGEAGAQRFRLPLDDVTSFDFGKMQRRPAEREGA